MRYSKNTVLIIKKTPSVTGFTKKALSKTAISSETFTIQKKTMSHFTESRVSKNVIGGSSGEAAIDFFVSEIKDNGLYLLDEPENSLSPKFQTELAVFLLSSARFFGLLLIIATHSPFILSIPGAKMYNLDTSPVSVTRDFTELESIRLYYKFFKNLSDRFEK